MNNYKRLQVAARRYGYKLFKRKGRYVFIKPKNPKWGEVSPWSGLLAEAESVLVNLAVSDRRDIIERLRRKCLFPKEDTFWMLFDLKCANRCLWFNTEQEAIRHRTWVQRAKPRALVSIPIRVSLNLKMGKSEEDAL